MVYINFDKLQEGSTVSAYEVVGSALVMCCIFNSETIQKIFLFSNKQIVV